MIQCPNCKTENLPGSRFCEQCGADLRAVPSSPGLPSYGNPSGQQPIGQPTSPWAVPTPVGAPSPSARPKRKRRGCLITLLIILLVCCALPLGLFGVVDQTNVEFPGRGVVEEYISTVEAEMTQQAEPADVGPADATATAGAAGSNLKTNVAATRAAGSSPSETPDAAKTATPTP